MRVCYIYGMFDPKESEFFYIGSSVNPINRFSTHRKSKSAAPKVKEVINELEAEGFEPELRILEEVSTTERKRREGYWINYYQDRGHHLANRRSVWEKNEVKVVNIGTTIYKRQLEEIEEKASELNTTRTVLIRNMLDFALKNMFK